MFPFFALLIALTPVPLGTEGGTVCLPDATVQAMLSLDFLDDVPYTSNLSQDGIHAHCYAADYRTTVDTLHRGECYRSRWHRQAVFSCA